MPRKLDYVNVCGLVFFPVAIQHLSAAVDGDDGTSSGEGIPGKYLLVPVQKALVGVHHSTTHLPLKSDSLAASG